MKFLKTLFNRTTTKAGRIGFNAAPAPRHPVYVVGDIHGRFDLLQRLEELIAADRKASAFMQAGLVFVGDFVDRGENSRQVLEHLQKLCAQKKAVCLMGNHERMMLDFLADPALNGQRWFRNGGLQTLASFGVGGVGETAGTDSMVLARDRLRAALPPGLESWISTLPLDYQTGNLLVVHAAADPSLPVKGQSGKTLLWGHPDFARTSRQDGVWVAHGHTVVDVASAQSGRISIDTGAYFSGHLSVAIISSGDIRFLAT